MGYLNSSDWDRAEDERDDVLRELIEIHEHRDEIASSSGDSMPLPESEYGIFGERWI